MAQKLLKTKRQKVVPKKTAGGRHRNAQKKKFEVLLTATLQKKFIVEASDERAAEKLVEKRWSTGAGGAIRHDDLECVDVQFDVVGKCRHGNRCGGL